MNHVLNMLNLQYYSNYLILLNSWSLLSNFTNNRISNTANFLKEAKLLEKLIEILIIELFWIFSVPNNEISN